MTNWILEITVLLTSLLYSHCLISVDLNTWNTFHLQKNIYETYLANSPFERIVLKKETSNRMLLIQISLDEAMENIILDTQNDRISFTNSFDVNLSNEFKTRRIYLRFTCLNCQFGLKYANSFQLISNRHSPNQTEYPLLDKQYLKINNDTVRHPNSNIPIREIKDNELIPEIDFTQRLEYGFYYDVSKMSADDIKYFTLYFKQAVDLSETNFYFITNQERVSINEPDLSQYLPTEERYNSRAFARKNQYATIVFLPRYPESETETEIIFLLVKFKNFPTASPRAEMTLKQKIDNVFIITKQNPSGRFPITLLGNSPYILFIMSENGRSVIFSDFYFYMFEGKELEQNFASFSEGLLEFYAPAGLDIFIHYDVSDYEFSQREIQLNEEISNLDSIFNRYVSFYIFVISAKSILQKSNKYLYYKKELGDPFKISYSSFDSIDTDPSLIYPQKYNIHNEPINLSNFFIFKVRNPYSYFRIGIVEKINQVIIEDKEKLSYIHIFDTGAHSIQLNNLIGRNIEVTLIQMSSEANKEITLSIKGDSKIINTETNYAVQFFNIQENTMNINNLYKLIVLEFKVSQRQPFVEIYPFPTVIIIPSKYIYLKFNLDLSLSFSFQFSDQNPIRYNYGVGNSNFISKPMFTSQGSIHLQYNPYSLGQNFLSEEFIYISFEVPNIGSSLTIKINSDYNSPYPIQQLTELRSSTIPLLISKETKNTHVVMFLFQCKNPQYSLSINYLSFELFSINSMNSAELITLNYNNGAMELNFREPITNGYFFAYNYMSESEAQAFQAVSSKDLLTINFNKKTKILTWSNPNELFTEFRVYIQPVTRDLSNECQLNEITDFSTPTTPELDISSRQLENEKYKVNVVAVKTNQIDLLYAYKEIIIDNTNIHELSTTESFTIFFDNLPNGFYINLNNYKCDEEGLLLLSFYNDIPDTLPSQLILAAQIIHNANIEQNWNQFIPTSEDKSDFRYEFVQNRYIKMYFKNKCGVASLKDPKSMDILAIGIKSRSYDTRVLLNHIKVSSSELLIGPYQSYKSSIRTEGTYLLKFKNTDPKVNQTLLFISDKEVTIYKESILNNQGQINPRETVMLKTFTDYTSNVYVLEYLGRSQTFNLYFERIDDTITIIPNEKITTPHFSQCTRDFIGKSEYVAGLFMSFPNYNQYYIYSKQEYGKVDTYYTNNINLGTIVKTILPEEASYVFTGLSRLTNPYFVMKFKCQYPGERYVQLLKPSANIILDSGNNFNNNIPNVYLLLQGENKISFQNLRYSNIEINLIDVSKGQNNNIEVKIGSNEDTLNLNSKILRYTIREETMMIINNPNDYIAIEFKMDSNHFVQVAGDRRQLINKYIYYKFSNNQAPYYVFEFNRRILENLTYTVNKGIQGYITKPIRNVIVNSEKSNSFNVANPYGTYNEIASNEFWYISMKIPDEIDFYDLFVYPKNSESPIIPSTDLKLLKDTKNRIESNQDKSKSDLVIFLAQCSPIISQLKVYYDTTVLLTQQVETMRQCVSLQNQFAPLEVSYDYASKQTVVPYHLSYNYVTQSDAKRIKDAISTDYDIKYANNKLTWTKPDIPIKKASLYLIDENSTDKITNECEMLSLNKGIVVESNEYSLLNNSKLVSGKYRVNILIESEDKLQYAIAYSQITIDYSIPESGDSSSGSNTGLIVGIVFGVLAVIGLGLGLLFWRRKKKIDTSEQKFGILSSIQE